MTRVEVITGPERRRRWTDEQKQALVAASLAPGAIVSQLARHADVRPSQIYRWRQEFGALTAGFAQVLIAPAEAPAAAKAADSAACGEAAIEVEFAGKARVRIPSSVPAELAAAVIKALSR